MFDPQNKTYTPIDGYTHYAYAVLHTTGIGHVFDTLRYDRAFFARRKDVDDLIALSENYIENHDKSLQLLVCKYAWTAPKKVHWTHARLMRSQRFEEPLDLGEVYKLEATFTASQPKPKLKVRCDCEVTGPLPVLLDVMFRNHAMPCDEGDSRRIEDLFSAEKGRSITVKLTNFLATEGKWDLPQGQENA